VILKALQREEDTAFLPLVIYILTHELIHIVRFNRFEQRFYAIPEEKEREEIRVHAITYDILKGLRYGGMSSVLDSFSKSRTYMGHVLDFWKAGEKI
jgi:hypothetical protein